jgi:3-isopropylmalate/(R)-2-methylmalate dehydratase small subunit
MEKFSTVNGVAASFPKINIDTDAIIPASWQRSLKHDPGEGLFGGWRYDLDGKEIPDFILNREPFRKSKIIVGGPNFGCGSSREFAVWALMRFGIRVVMAPSFGDIFYENSFKNGLLLIILPQAVIDGLHAHLAKTNDPTLIVDLERNIVDLPNGERIEFEIPAVRRTALLEGLDEIGQTLKFDQAIAGFQGRQRTSEPWVYERPAWQSPAKTQDSV